MKRKNVLIIIAAKGFNETEFLTVKNELLKNSIGIFIASDSNGLCLGDKGMKIKADVQFYNINCRNFEAIIVIGGKGIIDYLNNELLLNVIRSFYRERKITASICAAGVILARAGIAGGTNITGYPDIKSEVEKSGGIYVDEPVAIYKNIITGKDPAAAYEFISAVIDALK